MLTLSIGGTSDIKSCLLGIVHYYCTRLLSRSPDGYALGTSIPKQLAASCAQPIRSEQPSRCLLADLSLLCTALI